ncbi:S8 family peptidase [Nonomuraea longicatena]|uniref:S8 family serine peptidase n=1 Tax=Nonomuraea longicatena TaxID=83682 RepID=A0ABN1QMI8_9ACTN
MRRWQRWTAVAAGAALTALSAVDPGAAATAETPAPESDERAYDVTLITGDRVHVVTTADGRSRASVTPRPDNPPSGFRIREHDGRLTVVPADVAHLIPGRLDPALFDVTTLKAEGVTDRLPLIVEYGTGPMAAPFQQVTPLESIGGGAVRLDLRQAAAVGARTSVLDSAAKIWLDRRVKSVLEHSVPQIGAPQAWAAGFDGKGTTVAVLDTGIDAGHPDLTGRVAAAQDFTEDGTTADLNGHGTHVAGTIAGTASARKGVAPGVNLLNGRVLNGDGQGLTSWIIQGMEWAAKEKDADIVNMSLGGGNSFGPMSEAVDELTRSTGALFVIAAGNDGCGTCVYSPGDAASALTVGAVDSADKLADFSSYGPAGTYRAVKPELTAPGVGIVAARAEGTTPGTIVDGVYARLSGTSMATPHVAGAAALLRQARPGITGQELKSLLMGNAKSMQDTPMDKRGTGRVDVPAALAAKVVADAGALDFGRIQPGQPATREVTYRNLGQEPVTLALSASGFAVTPQTLTVPPGGKAGAKVTYESAEPGPFRGELRADSGPVTLLTGAVDSKWATLRIIGVGRDGRPSQAYPSVVNVETGTVEGREMSNDAPKYCEPAEPGEVCLSVPHGTYSVTGVVHTMRPDADSLSYGGRGDILNRSFTGDPEVNVEGDLRVVLDARKANEIVIDTPDHETRANNGGAIKLAWTRTAANGNQVNEIWLPLGNGEERFYLEPTDSVKTGKLSVATRWRLEAPEIAMSARGLDLDPEYVDPMFFSTRAAEYPRFDGRARLRAVDAGKGGDLRGNLAVLPLADAKTVAAQANAAAAKGARMVAFVGDGSLIEYGGLLKVPTVRLSERQGGELLRRLGRESVHVRVEGVSASPYVYDLYLSEEDRIRRKPHYTVRSRSLARIETAIHSQLGGTPLTENRTGWQPWERVSFDAQLPVRAAPRTRVDYVTAAPGIRWNASFVTPEMSYAPGPPREDPQLAMAEPADTEYRPGQRVGRSFFKQPLQPGHARPVRRDAAEDLLSFDMSAALDAGGNVGTPHWMRSDWRMYQGDKLVARTSGPPQGRMSVPAERTAYRIEWDVANQAAWARWSTRSKSEWTFSTEKGRAEVPMVSARFDAPTGMDGVARSRTLGLRVDAAERIASVGLEVSYDDGSTWQRVNRLRGEDGRYETVLPRSGVVSLRVTAATATATLRQELIRAYEVK